MNAVPMTEMVQRAEGWYSQAVLKEIHPQLNFQPN